MPNAEPLAAFRGRIEQCLARIRAQHAGQSVAVLCHGGVIRMLLALLLQQPLSSMASFDVEYASLTRIDLHPHKTRVKLLNFTPWRDLT
jgi:broad specificity phosphatase PhoE